MAKRSLVAISGLLFSALHAGCGAPPEGSVSIRAASSHGVLPPFTVTAAGTVLNSATALTADAAQGAVTLTVASTAALNNAISGNLAADDQLLVVQMQGAAIDTSAAGLGAVSALNGAGQFELVTVQGFTATTITLNNCGGLAHAYAAAAHVQVVRVPQYTSLTINAGASVTAPAWNGSSGGIVAVQVSGALAVNGAIDVSGLGFRGGKVDQNNDAILNRTNAIYFSTSKTLGAEKGEGVAGSQTTYDAGAGRYGRGAPANGGGGGDAHNAGGGGGANASNGSTYTGAGVMPPGLAGNAAWALDSDDIANGGRTNSSGGGRGGYSYSANKHDATTTAPGSGVWGGDNRRQVGGRGGHPLAPAAASALFFGGGGGAGDANNNAGGSGGNGGGLIFAIAGNVSGAGAITANGAPGGPSTGTANDGPGGGGGGGTVVIAAGTVPAGLSLSAAGGAGGSQPITTNEAEGSGGGGGGGFIALSAGAPGLSVVGGAGGTTTSAGVGGTFPRNGGTDGAAGATVTAALSYPVCRGADVSATLTDGTSTATPGGTTTYTLVIDNSGPGAANLSLTSTLPAAITNLSWTCAATGGANCGVPTSGTGAIAPAGASVPAGGKLTFTAVATISPTATGTLSVTAGATVTNTTQVSDPNPANNSATDVDTLVPSSDLTLTAAGSSSANAGAGVSYDLTVNNAGPSAIANATVTYPLPAGWSYLSSSGTGWSCASATGTVTCTQSSVLSPGNAPALTINAITSPSGTGTVASTFTAGPAGSDPNPNNNSAQVNTALTVSPDLSLTAPPIATVTAGANATYNLTLTNNGPSAAAGPVISYTMPAGFSFVSAAGAGWSCSAASGVVTCTFSSSLGAAAQSTLALTVRTPANGTGAVSSTFTAGVAGDPNAANNSVTVGSTFADSADLSAQLMPVSQSVRVGAPISLQLAVANAGPSDAQGVSATVTLPAGFSAASGSGTGWSCTSAVAGATTVSCTLSGALAAGSAAALTVSANVPTATGTVMVTAQVASTTADPGSANNSASASVTVTSAVADLGITLTGPANGTAGRPLDEQIVVTNAGPSPAAPVTVTIPLPPGSSFVGTPTSYWTCTAQTSPAPLVTCVLTGPLQAGGSSSLDVQILPDPNSATSSVTASVASSAQDPDPSNNTSQPTSTAITAQADLAVALTPAASGAAPGAQVSFALAASSTGPSAAQQVTLSLLLPAGFSAITPSSADAWSCSTAAAQAGQAVTCTLPSLAAGASSSVAVAAQAPGALGNSVLSAQIASPVPDPAQGNNSASATLSVTSSASHLMLALTGPAAALATDPLHYTAAVTNAGPSPAGTLAVTVQLPAQAQLQSWAGTGWSCGAPSGPALSCAYAGPLPAGQSAPDLTLTVTPPPEGGSATLSADATSNSSNPTPADAQASVTTVITAEADLSVKLTASAASVAGSAAITYSLVAANAGPSTAASLSLTATLAAGFTSPSASGTGWSCALAPGAGGTTAISCTAASLAQGPASPVTLSATAPAAQGTYDVSASVSSATSDPLSSNNSAALQTVVSTASADLAITLTGPATAPAGGALTYAATVTNLGPSPASAVQVVLPLPDRVTFSAGTGTGWTCTEATVGGTGSVVCSLAGTLAVGAPAPGLSLNLVAPAEGGSVSVPVVAGSSAADPDLGNNLGGPVVTQVAAAADLGVTLSSSTPSVAAGAGVDFTVGVTNAGPSTARAAQITVAVAGAVSATGAGWLCSVSAGQATCTTASLATGSAPAVTVHAVAPAAAGQMVASATIASATNDPALANNSATASVAVTASADLSVSATAASPIDAAGPAVLTVAVANAGPSDASGVSLTLSVPAGASFAGAAGAGWTCTPGSAAVTCAFAGTLASGGSAPLTVTLTAPATQGAASSQITVSANEPDPVPANDTTLVSFTVGPPATGTADLAVSLAAPSAIVYAGGQAQLMVTAQNLGPDTAQTVTLTFTLPGARGLTASGPGWTCGGAGPVSCTRATFAVGTSQLVLAGALDATATASASITSQSADPKPDNNSAAVAVVVLASPDVRLTAAGTPASVVGGGAITYAVVATNRSGSAATGVSVATVLPAGSSFVSGAGAGWSCVAGQAQAAQAVTCTSSSALAAGASAAFTLVVNAPQAAGDALATFTLATSTPNAAPLADTQATVHTAVTAQAEADQYIALGRGCSTGGVGPDGLCLLGLAALFAFARRRKDGSRRAQKAPAQQPRARLAAPALLGAALVLGAASAQAQSMSTGIDVQQFKPMPGAADVLGVQSAQTLERKAFHWQLTLNGANDPLGLVDPSNGRPTRQLVDSQFGADLMASYSLLDRLELGAALPIALQNAQALPGTSAGAGATPSSFGLGDLRVVPKLRLNERTRGLTFAISMPIILPLAGGANFLGQSGAGLRPRVIAEWTLKRVRFAANLGIDLRRAEDFLNVRTGTAFSYGLAAEASLGSLKLLGRPLLAQATWVGAVGLQSDSGHQANRPSEILGALVWQLSEGLAVQAGAGPGVSRGYGTPEYRALISISYTQVPPPADRDHDGIPDSQDACPDLPGVASADRTKNGCPLPPPDRDHDGIADADDACPDVPGVASPDKAKNGCPAPAPQPELVPLVMALPVPPPDRDGDGIPDSVDACPDIAGVASSDPELNGCPKATAERKVVLEGKRIIILEKVHFALAKDLILASSFPLLRQVANTLRDHPEIELIRVEGHTDNQGNAKANLDLSRRRANMVRHFLLGAGIDPERVQAVGLGQQKPIAPNLTSAGRELNRRVEFNILKMKEPPAVQ